MEVPALRQRGWSISAIARHAGWDCKTVRAYLNGDRTPGVRARSTDPFGPFLPYVTARLLADPHLWALALFDELLTLGFTASYPTLTRQIRATSRTQFKSRRQRERTRARRGRVTQAASGS